MRAPGEVRQALLCAAAELATPERGPTLAELAARAQVGRDVALHTVKNMKRSGELTVPRTRRVAYRNRPVAEYAPAVYLPTDGSAHPPERADEVLRDVMVLWVNR